MSDQAWIVEHVGAQAFELLAEGLGGSELQSVLLKVIATGTGSQVIAARFGGQLAPTDRKAPE